MYALYYMYGMHNIIINNNDNINFNIKITYKIINNIIY